MTYFSFGRISRLSFLLALFILGSMAGSYTGANEGVRKLTYAPAVVDIDSIDQKYSAQIEELRTEKKSLEGQKNEQGQTYYKLMSSINLISKQIAETTSLKNDQIVAAEEKNNGIEYLHGNDTKMKAEYFALGALGFDAMIALFVWFTCYCDQRDVKERKAIQAMLAEKEAQAVAAQAAQLPTQTQSVPTQGQPQSISDTATMTGSPDDFQSKTPVIVQGFMRGTPVSTQSTQVVQSQAVQASPTAIVPAVRYPQRQPTQPSTQPVRSQPMEAVEYSRTQSTKGLHQTGKVAKIHHKYRVNKKGVWIEKDAYYTLKAVDGRIKDYSNRTKDAHNKYKSNPTQHLKGVYANNDNWKKYWKERRLEFGSSVAIS